MKTLFLTLILFSTLFGGEGYATDHWLHNYKKALQQAQKEGKKVYLFIGADKCHFCKMFKEKTLAKKGVMQRLTQEYVPVYLSRDRHKIPDKFEKFGAPRHYFLDKNGKILFATFGVLEPEGFFTTLDEADLNAQN